MARTTFSGPVFSGIPDNIFDNTSGTTAYGFYTRVEIGSATGTSFGSSSYQTPGEAYGVFGRTQGGAPFSTTQPQHSIMLQAQQVTLQLLALTLTTV